MLRCGLEWREWGKEAKKEELKSEWTGWETRPRITNDWREVRDNEEGTEKGDSGQVETSASPVGLCEGVCVRA